MKRKQNDLNTSIIDEKVRFKLYKAGKHWVKAGIKDLALLRVMGLPMIIKGINNKEGIEVKANNTVKEKMAKASAFAAGGFIAANTIDGNQAFAASDLPVTSEVTKGSEVIANQNSTILIDSEVTSTEATESTTEVSTSSENISESESESTSLKSSESESTSLKLSESISESESESESISVSESTSESKSESTSVETSVSESTSVVKEGTSTSEDNKSTEVSTSDKNNESTESESTSVSEKGSSTSEQSTSELSTSEQMKSELSTSEVSTSELSTSELTSVSNTETLTSNTFKGSLNLRSFSLGTLNAVNTLTTSTATTTTYTGAGTDNFGNKIYYKLVVKSVSSTQTSFTYSVSYDNPDTTTVEKPINAISGSVSDTSQTTSSMIKLGSGYTAPTSTTPVTTSIVSSTGTTQLAGGQTPFSPATGGGYSWSNDVFMNSFYANQGSAIQTTFTLNHTAGGNTSFTFTPFATQDGTATRTNYFAGTTILDQIQVNRCQIQ
ncbi:KxYKxGKxW signal peptide domain-containing protein [Macrococcus animalis]|uniref:KxYKxGKxW signal peptide domain-containing protein n=1 Tax=Macrococcus animalis TaxID=3395467 RepID=UPI0039BDFE2A